MFRGALKRLVGIPLTPDPRMPTNPLAPQPLSTSWVCGRRSATNLAYAGEKRKVAMGMSHDQWEHFSDAIS